MINHVGVKMKQLPATATAALKGGREAVSTDPSIETVLVFFFLFFFAWRWKSMRAEDKKQKLILVPQRSLTQHSFKKMLRRTSPMQSCDNRRHQVTLFRAKMRVAIPFNGRRKRFIARTLGRREEATALRDPALLCCLSLWPLLTTPSRVFFFFFFLRQELQREFPAVSLPAQRMRGTLTPRTRAESNIAECSDAPWPPFFLFHYSLVVGRSSEVERRWQNRQKMSSHTPEVGMHVCSRNRLLVNSEMKVKVWMEMTKRTKHCRRARDEMTAKWHG